MLPEPDPGPAGPEPPARGLRGVRPPPWHARASARRPCSHSARPPDPPPASTPRTRRPNRRRPPRGWRRPPDCLRAAWPRGGAGRSGWEAACPCTGCPGSGRSRTRTPARRRPGAGPPEPGPLAGRPPRRARPGASPRPPDRRPIRAWQRRAGAPRHRGPSDGPGPPTRRVARTRSRAPAVRRVRKWSSSSVDEPALWRSSRNNSTGPRAASARRNPVRASKARRRSISGVARSYRSGRRICPISGTSSASDPARSPTSSLTRSGFADRTKDRIESSTGWRNIDRSAS